MEQEQISREIAAAERVVEELTQQLERAKQVVQQWVDANASLSLSASQARAENQSKGRGLLGAILGAKYRAAVRSDAASSNAAIAKDVAAKRINIADGKREAQQLVKQLQAELTAARQALKALERQQKSSTEKVASVNPANQSLTLLKKLKQAYDSGILTQQEYEEKRRKLVSNI
ncbi:MAG: SHOCT domain-containing protein [Candidatus Accumulibacter propinquus]|jgi:regulator of replication initiation timing|uniref:SHOCT domain-containing protein n=1 Tax=Candidatus Accumulibacter propinquus TaxID=2954380 RepID=UPI002FC32EAF